MVFNKKRRSKKKVYFIITNRESAVESKSTQGTKNLLKRERCTHLYTDVSQ